MKILITILLLALGACTVDDSTQGLDVKRYKLSPCDRVKMVTLDKCEYLIYTGCRGGGIIHKANCSNPIHYEAQSKVK